MKWQSAPSFFRTFSYQKAKIPPYQNPRHVFVGKRQADPKVHRRLKIAKIILKKKENEKKKKIKRVG